MGVKGLQFYSENHSNNICQIISISELASRYPERKVLLVDGMSLINKLCSKEKDWIYGGQWKEYIRNLKSFVDKFKCRGIDLVFFFDGSVCRSKRIEWVNRRLRRLKDIIEIFNFIKQTRQHPPEKMFQLPAGMGALTRYVVKYECDCEVHTSIEEADQEMADYANSNPNCFAILSQDSDFLIYDTKPYLSITHLDLNKLTTVMYDRDQLAREIGIDKSLLPLFSCMAGNDIIQVDLLRPFQKYLCNTYRNPSITDLLPKIGSFIRSKGWTGREIEEIASCLRIDSELLREGLSVYSRSKNRIFTNNTNTTDVLDTARTTTKETTGPCLIYTLLTRQEYESSEVLEDESDGSLYPSAIIYRAPRSRMYALVFDSRTVPVKEWCAYYGNNMTRPEIVAPSRLDYRGEIPSLHQRWLNIPEMREQKWELFRSCLGISIPVSELKKIPYKLITLCSILNYLLLQYGMTHITAWEIKAFICQAISPRAQNVENILEVKIPYVESRAVQLATLFMRGVTQVQCVNFVCGEPFPSYYIMPWHYFDGKLFHYYYIMAKNRVSEKELCENQDTIWRQFDQLFRITTFNTELPEEQYEDLERGFLHNL